MSGAGHGSWATIPADEERYRPLYARILGLRFVNPGGVLCFLFFEGVVALAALLALAELVTWWAVLVLPAAVAVMVKLNDMVAALVVRSAAAVPEQERERFRRQMEPVVGRAQVEWITHSVPGVVITSEPVRRPARNKSGGGDRPTGVAPATGAGGSDPPGGPGSVRRASSPPEIAPGVRRASSPPEIAPGVRRASSPPETAPGARRASSPPEIAPGVRRASSSPEIGPGGRGPSSPPETGPGSTTGRPTPLT